MTKNKVSFIPAPNFVLIDPILKEDKSSMVAVVDGVVIRASSFPEEWAIVAGTTEKAKIIMEPVIEN